MATSDWQQLEEGQEELLQQLEEAEDGTLVCADGNLPLPWNWIIGAKAMRYILENYRHDRRKKTVFLYMQNDVFSGIDPETMPMWTLLYSALVEMRHEEIVSGTVSLGMVYVNDEDELVYNGPDVKGRHVMVVSEFLDPHIATPAATHEMLKEELKAKHVVFVGAQSTDAERDLPPEPEDQKRHEVHHIS